MCGIRKRKYLSLVGVMGVMLAIGTLLFALGPRRKEGSAPLLQESVKASAQAYYNQAEALWRQGQVLDAAGYLWRALELDPNHLDALILYADIVLAHQAYEEAVIYYERALALMPPERETKSLLMSLGNAYQGKGDLAKAQEIYESLLQKEPKDPQLLLALGDVHFAQNAYAQAESYYRDALAQVATPYVQIKLGNTYLAQNKLNEAEEIFTEALKTTSAAEAHLGLGEIYMRRGENGKALQQYREGFKAAGPAVAPQAQYQLKSQLGERILELEPDDVSTRFELAELYQEQHVFEAAIEHYQKILAYRLAPEERLRALQGLGESYLGRADYESAKVHFKAALKIAETTQLYELIVEAEQRLVGVQGKLGEDGLQALYTLARLYAQKDQVPKAIDILKRLQHEYPDYRPAEVAKLLSELISKKP